MARDPEGQAASFRRVAAVAVVGAMVVEVALVIALLIGVCLGFWLRKAWSTTTRASKETTAIICTHCEMGNDDDKDKGQRHGQRQ